METLLILAQIAITLAGFSAVVIMQKRGADDSWHEDDANRFMGMVIHALMATGFALLPPFLVALAVETNLALRLGSALLGAQILGHALWAGRLELRRGHRLAASELLVIGTLAAGLQLVNVLAIAAERALGIYLAGILWHVMQAAVLFVMMVWIPAARIRPRGES